MNVAQARGDMTVSTYESIVLLHHQDARAVLKLLDTDGEKAAIKKLRSMHVPGEGTIVSTRGMPWNDDDQTFEDEGYVMYYNRAVGYVGLVFRIEFPPDPA